MNRKSITILIVTVVVSLGIGFFGGVQYQKTKKVTFNRTEISQNQYGMRNTGTTVRSGNGIAKNGSQPVSGEITSIDNGSITVKTQDGGSKIVTVSGSTTIKIATNGSLSNLAKGDTVMIIGTTNTDGTISAKSVTTGMQFQGGMGQPPSGN